MFAHLLSAQLVWFNRIEQIADEVKIWPDLTDKEIRGLLQENPAKLKSVVNKKDEIITYRNSKGDKFQNTVEEIFQHVIIHGQHHRAQIALLLRKSGVTPPGTDFILYLRNT